MTPRQRKRDLVFEVVLLRFLPGFLQLSTAVQFLTGISSLLPGPVKMFVPGLPFNKLQQMERQHLVLIHKSAFPHFYWHKKEHDRFEAEDKGLRLIDSGKANGCNNERMYLALLSYQKRK